MAITAKGPLGLPVAGDSPVSPLPLTAATAAFYLLKVFDVPEMTNSEGILAASTRLVVEMLDDIRHL